MLLLACLLALPANPLSADTMPPEMEELARLYRVRVGEFTARYQETVKSLPGQYAADLAALLEHYQKKGNLDGVLAVAREQKRFADALQQSDRDPFEQTPELPASSIVSQPAELRARQELYLKQHREASTSRQREISDLTTKYLARLENVQRDLTRAGRIREAVTVKQEIDRLTQGVADDTLVSLAEGFPAELSAAAGATVTSNGPVADGTEADAPMYGSVPNWAKWRFDQTTSFAREGTLFGHPDIPDEIDANYNTRTGRGRFYGRCNVDRRQVGGAFCAWFGKALLWRVKDPTELGATVEFESAATARSVGQDGGPHAQLIVLSGHTLLKVLNVPLMSARATLRVFYDADSNRCALQWVQGKSTEVFDLPVDAELWLMLAVVVRNPGEECDSSFSLLP